MGRAQYTTHVRQLTAVAVAAIAVAGSRAALAADVDVKQEKLQARIAAIRTEYNAMREGEGAPKSYKEYAKLQKEWQRMHARHREALAKPQERMEELAKEEDVLKWQAGIREKAAELNSAHRELQAEIHRRGKELHARRQAELAAIAVADVPEGRAMGFAALTYPRVDGSTSAQPLGMVIACKLLGNPYHWAGTARYSGRWLGGGESIRREDYMPFAPMAGSLSGREMPWRASSQFSLIGYRAVAKPSDLASPADVRQSAMINRMLTVHAGTHGAYKNVINRHADIGLVARRPSSAELELAEEKNVVLHVEPCALDAFVFIVNHKTPVANLTTEQIRDIYGGKLTKWEEIGGAEGRINAYQRDPTSGSQELMVKLVMKGREFAKPEHGRARQLVRNGMGGPYIALSHDQRGLAYSVYYYEHFMSGSPNTKSIAVDGVLPSYETIRTRRYPYTTEVYAVTRKGLSPNSPAGKLRKWLLSPEGQSVVRESGYVPLPRTP